MDEKRPDDEVFDGPGDRTVMRMQSQPFLAEEFGTMAITEASELPAVADGDEVTRLRRKVETLTALVEAMQRRLESIDAAVARFVAKQT